MKQLAVTETLRLGIKAARDGLNEVAREYFTTVLKQDDRNIPAMLWLAYLSPSPEDSLRLLESALSLDPDNQHAQSGLQWARKRLNSRPNKPTSAKSQKPSAPIQTKSIAANVPSPPKKRAKPTQRRVKRRAQFVQFRYALRVLIVTLAVGALGMAIGLGASIVVLPDTLAALLPAPALSPDKNVTLAEPTQSVRFVKIPQVATAKNFISVSDTIILPAPRPIEIEEAIGPTPLLQEIPGSDSPVQLAETTLGLPSAETAPVSLTELPLLIGPAVPIDPTPVDPALLAHQPAYPGEKWIEVNVTTQEITAWEGNVPVMSFIVSTGLPNTPTVLGEFNIYWKLKKTLMTGFDYYLPDVPYTMYFYEGYALHGTYWHNNFGQRMSRGCVNLSIDNAKKLFEWADPVIPPGQTQVVATHDNPGTLVVVHE